MNNLILGAINKSIGNKKYHLHNIDELIQILKKEKNTIIEKYYLKELFSIPASILEKKLFKYLNKGEKIIFLQKAKEFVFLMKISKNLLQHFKLQIETLEFLQKNIFSKIPKGFKNYYAFGGGT